MTDENREAAPEDSSLATDASAPAPEKKSLPTRRLPRTRLSLTNLTLGTWGLAEGAYGPATRAELEAVVRTALEEGIRSFDVAPLWGDGLAEEVVGACIRDCRDEVTVISRAGAFRKGDHVVRMFDGSALEASVEASRRRLGTHVDLLALHDPPEKILGLGTFAKTLASMVSRGSLGGWGVSTPGVEAAKLAMGFGAAFVVVPHHLLLPDVVPALLEDATAFGSSILVRSPLAHGLLTETGLAKESFAEGDHRSARWNAETLATRKKQARGLSAVWVQKAPSLAAFALRFALTPESVATAIVGPRTPAQVRELADAVRTVDRLTPELVEKTTQISSALGV